MVSLESNYSKLPPQDPWFFGGAKILGCCFRSHRFTPPPSTHTPRQYKVLGQESYLKSQYCTVNVSPRFEKLTKKIEITFKEYIHWHVYIHDCL